MASIVSADKEKEGIQSRHEATLIAGYDIPMQIMAEILEDKGPPRAVMRNCSDAITYLVTIQRFVLAFVLKPEQSLTNPI